jgi:hypothetical protein
MGSALWRTGGRLHATVVVKATFAFTLDDEVACIAPEPIRRSDECARGVPSLRGACEIAPRLEQAEVVLYGHAYAPPGTTKSSVRLRVERGGAALIDKTLLVYGDRKRSGQGPKPFQRLRIGYERALGGLDFAANPIGVGAEADGDELPNIVHPVDPHAVAGFGPIPARFPVRRKLRGRIQLALIENGIADYPKDFAWTYFQTAPPDQRLPSLHGDEWIVLEGLHPSHSLIRTQLASMRGMVRVYSRQDVGAPTRVHLTLDTLHVEPSEARCSLLWRGSFPIASELAAQQLVAAGGLERSDRPLQWPATIEEVDQLASPEIDVSALVGGAEDDLQRTAVPHKRRVTPAPPSAPYSSDAEATQQHTAAATRVPPKPPPRPPLVDGDVTQPLNDADLDPTRVDYRKPS